MSYTFRMNELIVAKLLHLLFSIKLYCLLNSWWLFVIEFSIAENEKFSRKKERRFLSSFSRHQVAPGPLNIIEIFGLQLYEELRAQLTFTEQMRFEWARLETFKRAPPTLQEVISATRLARDGFYYTGEGHDCKCAFCGFLHRDWARGDSPKDIHMRLKPQCKFLYGDEVNIPINNPRQRHSSPFSIGTREQSAVFTRHGHVSTLQPTSHEAIDPSFSSSIFVEKLIKKMDELLKVKVDETHGYERNRNTRAMPKYQQMEPFAERLRTFKSVTVQKRFVQTPSSLAMSGFFYTGQLDEVRCHFCGVGLRSWEPDDDPWIEHARWSPECQYLRQQNGDEFVENVQATLKEQTNNDSQNKTQDTQSQGRSGDIKEVIISEEEKILCIVCKDEVINVACIPCGHVFCYKCISAVHKCPRCETLIKKRIFLQN